MSMAGLVDLRTEEPATGIRSVSPDFTGDISAALTLMDLAIGGRAVDTAGGAAAAASGRQRALAPAKKLARDGVDGPVNRDGLSGLFIFFIFIFFIRLTDAGN